MVSTEYDERGSDKVLVCDCCDESVDTLYEANGKQLCRKCLLEECKDDFIAMCWTDICDSFGDDYIEGFDEVEVDDFQ